MSDDQKEDWVLEVEGKKIGVLPALRQELMTETGQDFQIYTVPRFLSYVKKTESPELGEESIEEAATVRDQRVATVEARDLAGFLQAVVPIREDYSAGAHRVWRSLKDINPSIASKAFERARLQATLTAVTHEIARMQYEVAAAQQAGNATSADETTLYTLFTEQVKKLDTLQLLRRELDDHLALLALDKESEHK
ncbi:hypothetical protein [Paraburkholderia sp. CI3]|uniref:hypothetical protein n=1 Tax=Paraburkholderia sp. CI3 TaxID=2991060 RepID=UPI003D1DE567